MQATAKMTVIGGGSPFVLVALQGFVQRKERWANWDGELLVDLYDVAPERTGRWVRYGELIARTTGIPLRVRSCAERREAVADAHVVLCSVGLPGLHQAAQEARERFGFHPHCIHDGPPAFLYAAHLYPFNKALAEEMAEAAPDGWLLILPNPTDTLAEAVARATGVPVAGFCVEVEQTRDYLAYYLGVPVDSVVLHHAGVNHGGWILRLDVGGEDGYARYHDELLRLSERADFHPGNFDMVELYRATGYLRSSAFHNWPYEIRCPYRGPNVWERFGLHRPERDALLEEALDQGRLLELRPDVHPDRWPINFGGTGRALADLLWSRVTGERTVLPLQVPNDGAVTNWPDDLRLEVPTAVGRDAWDTVPVGEMPAWLGEQTRMLAHQRLLAAEYLVTGDRETLRQALLAFPLAAPLDVLRDYATVVHAAWLEAQAS